MIYVENMILERTYMRVLCECTHIIRTRMDGFECSLSTSHCIALALGSCPAPASFNVISNGNLFAINVNTANRTVHISMSALGTHAMWTLTCTTQRQMSKAI